MRQLVQLTTATTMLAMVVASANSFSPSQKTHLATRLAPQAPLRVMPAMKIKSDSWLYVLGLPGFPSQYAKDEERHQVRPYHCARLAPLALAQRAWHLWHLPSPSACTASFRMHIARPCPLASPWSHAPLRPWPLASCPPAPLAPLACWRPSPPWRPSPSWAPRLPGTLASLGPHPLPGAPRLYWSPPLPFAPSSTRLYPSLSTASASAQADARSIDNTFLLAANVFAFLAALLLFW